MLQCCWIRGHTFGIQTGRVGFESRIGGIWPEIHLNREEFPANLTFCRFWCEFENQFQVRECLLLPDGSQKWTNDITRARSHSAPATTMPPDLQRTNLMRTVGNSNHTNTSKRSLSAQSTNTIKRTSTSDPNTKNLNIDATTPCRNIHSPLMLKRQVWCRNQGKLPGNRCCEMSHGASIQFREYESKDYLLSERNVEVLNSFDGI